MENLNHIDTLDLIDMLADYTEKFTHIFRSQPMIGFEEQHYLTCKNQIGLIVEELEKRRLFKQNEGEKISA